MSEEYEEEEYEVYECPECGKEICETEVEFECPNCYQFDQGEGFYTCKECGTLFTLDEELWVCQYCNNGEDDFRFGRCRCPQCGEMLDFEGECFACGWPANQGWLGENSDNFMFTKKYNNQQEKMELDLWQLN